MVLTGLRTPGIRFFVSFHADDVEFIFISQRMHEYEIISLKLKFNSAFYVCSNDLNYSLLIQ
jgi:hypothetical protein